MVGLLLIGLMSLTIFFTLVALKESVSDKRIRAFWKVLAAAMIAVVLLHALEFVVGREGGVLLFLKSVSIVLWGSILLGYSILFRVTLRYLRDLNKVDGLSIIDPVSGVYNRIYLEQRLNTEIARSQRYGSPLSVVTVEIMKFEKLNDEFGYQGSGIAIKKVAKKLTSLLRETDVVCSYGAGRFVLVLPDTPEGSIAGLINRLRSAIDGIVIIDGRGMEKSVSINVTFSYSHCDMKTDNSKALIDQAFESQSSLDIKPLEAYDSVAVYGKVL